MIIPVFSPKLDKILLFEIKYENNKVSTAEQVQVIP